MVKNYYEILNLDSNASKSDIKRAYLKLARKFHPDVNPHEDKSGERFKEINKAYVILSDPERRKTYDSIIAIEKSPPYGGGVKNETIHERKWKYSVGRKE